MFGQHVGSGSRLMSSFVNQFNLKSRPSTEIERHHKISQTITITMAVGSKILPHLQYQLVRLNKLVASKGLCSRREADRFIAQGLVQVNGVIVPNLGAKVQADATVRVLPEAARELSQQYTVLLNKPLGIVSSQAEHGYTPAIQLLSRRNQFFGGRRLLPENDNDNGDKDDDEDISLPPRNNDPRPTSPRQLRGWSAAGRLDINSTGLLVLTQAGRIVQEVIGGGQGENNPFSKVEKEYLVRVNPPLTSLPSSMSPTAATTDKVNQLLQGIECTGELLQAESVDVVNENQLRFVLTAGRKHHIRRMCRAVQLQVQALKRVRIGKVVLGDLPVGCWRYLRDHESFR
jgi:23S rRNA pseudouridine2604 synthase